MLATLIHAQDHWKCSGNWDKHGVVNFSLETYIDSNLLDQRKQVVIDGSHITTFDSAGALLLRDLQQHLIDADITVMFQRFSKHHQQLLETVALPLDDDMLLTASSAEALPLWMLRQLGEGFVAHWNTTLDLLSFLGEICVRSCRLQRGIFWLRANIFIKTIFDMGYQALPIIGLLSFLIGIVLVYQLSTQLKQYGANIYIVNLLGLSVFREFGSFLTAIVAAGRTSASFTAEIGTMKIRQELDALTTMGVRPMDILVLPKIVGLILVLPLLTVWADIFAIGGGMLMSHLTLNISYGDFLSRFQQSIHVNSFLIGLLKAPVFAVIIAMVGCFRGFSVGGSAESVGEQTTQSVVQSIFLIIVADAFFSVLFSWMGI